MAKSNEQFELDYQALQKAKKEFDMEQFLLKEVDLSKYFGREELDNMCDAAKRRHNNLVLNYEYMLHMGLPAIKPSFMVSPAQKARQAARERSPSVSSSSESDEEWTPDMGRKRKAKELKKAPCFHPRSRKKGNARKPNAITPKTKKRPMSPPKVLNTVEPGMSPPARRYNLRERTATNFMYLEPPDDDEFIYCEECNKEYDMPCPVHGALDHIYDKQFLQESSVSRAEQSLPPGLVVKPSSIPAAGLGVFTQAEIPSRTMYGPYGGDTVTDAKQAHASGYSWQVYKDGKPSHFVDALDKDHSNWMRYVNCANTEAEQNLVAFQYKGDIFYRSYKHIPADTELLVWYGNEYARELGVIRDKNLLIRPKLVNGEECFPCVFCKTVFDKAASCVRHLLNKHGGDKLTQTDCQVLDEWLRTNTIYKISRLAMSDTGNKPHKCDLCGYATDRQQNLDIHMRRHTGYKPFRCDQCDYRASTNSNLTTHMSTHTGDKPFRCDQCDYRTSTNSNLVTHIRRTHTGDKPFRCDQCDYRTSSNSSLTRHMMTHTGDKPFRCDQCDYRASTNSSLTRHMRRRHTGDKPFRCDQCDYRASTNSSLTRHMRRHTGDKPFRCDQCDYRASQNSNLTRHMRTHTGDKPF